MICCRILRPGILLTVFAGLALTGCRTWSGAEQRAAAAFNEGNVYRTSSRYTEAEDAYRRALEFRPGMTAPAFNLALVLVEQGREEEALDILQILHEQDPANLKLIRAMGWAHRRAGRSENALESYLLALGIFEADKLSLRYAAEIYEETGRFTEAEKLLRILIRIDSSAGNRGNLARILALDAKYSEALDEYRLLVLASEADADLLLRAASAAEEMEYFAEAAGYYKKAADSGEERSAEALFRLATIRLTELGDYEAGLEALSAALEKGFKDRQDFDSLQAMVPSELRPTIENLIEGTKPP